MRKIINHACSIILLVGVVSCNAGGTANPEDEDENPDGSGDSQGEVQTLDTEGLPEAGLEVFQNNCSSCHSLNELVEEKPDAKDIDKAMDKDQHDGITLSKDDLNNLEELVKAADMAADDKGKDKGKDKDKDKDKEKG